nr:YkvA family protein [Micromonospora sp. DSM 115978]
RQEAFVDSTTVLLVVLGVVAVLLLAVLGILIWLVKTRPPGKGVAATIAALAYAVSPVDAVPEVLLGPVGLIDDIAVVVGALLYVRNVVAEAKRDAEHRGSAAADRPPVGSLPPEDVPPQNHVPDRRARR